MKVLATVGLIGAALVLAGCQQAEPQVPRASADVSRSAAGVASAAPGSSTPATTPTTTPSPTPTVDPYAAGTIVAEQPDDLPKGKKWWALTGAAGQSGYVILDVGQPALDIVIQDAAAAAQGPLNQAFALGYTHQDTLRGNDQDVIDAAWAAASEQQGRLNSLLDGRAYVVLYPIYAGKEDAAGNINYGWWWHAGMGSAGSTPSMDYQAALASAQEWAAAKGYVLVALTP